VLPCLNIVGLADLRIGIEIAFGDKMTGSQYQRTLDQLRELASMFWPQELSEQEAKMSVIPKLLETQDDFIAILSVPVAGVDKLFQVIESSTFPANLFLKHLVVLSDFSGEMLQRINAQFRGLFPNGELIYLWNGEERSYQFNRLPLSGALTNKRLGISGPKFLNPLPLSALHNDDIALHHDVIALLILGNAASDENAANFLAKCEIGNYLGQRQKLEQFVKQRYIWVSRITAGAQSNTLGQAAQKFVQKHLIEQLDVAGVQITPGGHLPGITHTAASDRRLTTFDLVLAYQDKCVAVETSFQVTTNSVIERKAGQARSRFEQIDKAGYKIAYVIDGAGNFQRQSAVGTICVYSHCTVAFSREELDILCQFIREYFTQSG
jgi:hypothetical protein